MRKKWLLGDRKKNIRKSSSQLQINYWGQIGVISGAFARHFRLKSGPFRERLHVISGSNRGHFRSVCTSFQVQIGVISGMFARNFRFKQLWVTRSHIQGWGYFRGHVKVTLGSTLGRSGIVCRYVILDQIGGVTGSNGGHFGIRRHFGVIYRGYFIVERLNVFLGSLRGEIKVISGPFWERLKVVMDVTLGSFLDHLGVV